MQPINDWLRSGVILLLASFMLAGCSLLPVRYELPAAGSINCSEILAALDADIDRYTHFDPALHRLPGQPLLRSNRFLASYASPDLQGQALNSWLRRLNDLAREGYLNEFQRLPDNIQKNWQGRFPAQSVSGMLTQCSEAFLATPPTDIQAILDNVQPPSNYSNAQRFWGIYPLTKRLAVSSVEKYRAEMTARITDGKRQHFHQSTLYQLAPTSQPSENAAFSALFRQHAPELWVEKNNAADQLGAPLFQENSSIGLDTDTPQAYTYVTYTRYKQQVLTQLNYVYWFAARPKTSWSDLYGGDLDALVWRVTLSMQGRPVLYDSIHACGCYHVLFLPRGTTIDVSKIKGEKPLSFTLSAQTNSKYDAALRLKLDSGTHYLIDVAAGNTPQLERDDKPVISDVEEFNHYDLQPYQRLLTLPTSSGRQSLFGGDGIIAQSSRLERFVLWPLGVPNAGAMRQAGTHAIAFIGERHFDDPWLFDQLGVSIVDN